VDRPANADAADKHPLRFGSYIGLFYVVAILAILSFAVFYDTGAGHVFDRLEPGMSPTQVAAILGAPRSETKSGSIVVQTWRISGGQTLEVEFQDGRLTAKSRRVWQPEHPDSKAAGPRR
jgi:hypothetical protein